MRLPVFQSLQRWPNVFIRLPAMTLSAQHLHIITDTLGDESNNLETIVANLRQAVPNKAEHFDLCSALYVLLSDNLLISPLQKVVAFYVIAALNSSPLVTNSFFPAFAAVLEHAASEDWEVTYVASFIDGLPKEVRMHHQSCYTRIFRAFSHVE